MCRGPSTTAPVSSGVDIRTKLIFALVSVALAGMLAMGIVVSARVSDLMREGRLEQLDELAESRRQALLWIVEGWRDRADQIANRTLLRASLDEHARTGDPAATARIQATLRDALAAPRSPTSVRVFDLEGTLVTSAARGTAAGGGGAAFRPRRRRPPPPSTWVSSSSASTVRE